MISEQSMIFRINKLGKPFVQSEDPSFNNSLSVNDVWLNPSNGSMKLWNGTDWDDMKFGSSAIMDNAIANNMIANNISASKITTGILQSQDGDVYIDLESGIAKLYNLVLGGEVDGNVIATSSNGLTRIRLRGSQEGSNVTAGIIFEQRETTDSDTWSNAGQIYFGYSTRTSCATINCYQIGKYNGLRPNMGYNAGSDDGLMWRMLSTDWLKASYVTYHGTRLASRDSTNDSFENVTQVLTAVGNCMSGTAIVVSGTVTCTYKFNDVMQVDFNLSVTTSGSGSASYGISPTLLKTLNTEIPTITPMNGGVLQIYSSTGVLSGSYVGASFLAVDGLWKPASVVSSALAAINESAMTSGLRLIGTCYGTYNLSEE